MCFFLTGFGPGASSAKLLAGMATVTEPVWTPCVYGHLSEAARAPLTFLR